LTEKRGARVTNGVNKKTFAVIVKEDDFSRAKTEQAQSFNIPRRGFQLNSFSL
jgi:hypothetical protein